MSIRTVARMAIIYTLAKKKLKGSGKYPLMGLQHQVLLESTGKPLLEIA